MRKFAVSLIAIALVAAACGDDDPAGEPAPAATEAPAPQVTSAPPAPTQAPAEPTQPPATDPPATEAPVAPTTETPEDSAKARRIAGAALLAGDWVGEWNNTTFGSTGSIEVTVIVDTEVGFLLANTDIGGSVFGQVDPEPRTFELDLVTGPPYERRSGLLGEFTIVIGEDGSFTLTADDVSAEGIATMTITGTLGLAEFSATYVIGFEGGGTAEGTIEVAKVS
jgi:hypothetical protein